MANDKIDPELEFAKALEMLSEKISEQQEAVKKFDKDNKPSKDYDDSTPEEQKKIEMDGKAIDVFNQFLHAAREVHGTINDLGNQSKERKNISVKEKELIALTTTINALTAAVREPTKEKSELLTEQIKEIDKMNQSSNDGRILKGLKVFVATLISLLVYIRDGFTTRSNETARELFGEAMKESKKVKPLKLDSFKKDIEKSAEKVGNITAEYSQRFFSLKKSPDFDTFLLLTSR